MTRPVVLLFCLASLLLAAPAGADDETSTINICRDISHIARDVMTARHKNRPMSETLPVAMKLIEAWYEKHGLEKDLQQIEKAAAALVMDAYDSSLYPEYSGFDEERQKAISEFENLAFEQCYTEWKAD